MNAKDEGQQWERNYSIGGLVFYRNGEPPVKALYGEREILAHLNALQQQLFDAAVAAVEFRAEERVRVLEEALREMLDHLHNPFPDGTPKDGYTMKGHGIAYAAAVRHARTLLLSPAADTEGGEGA